MTHYACLTDQHVRTADSCIKHTGPVHEIPDSVNQLVEYCNIHTFLLQKERGNQVKSADALHLLAHKYGIPAVGNLAKRALILHLKPRPGEPLNISRGDLDPWMLAGRATQVNDKDLFDRSMSTICEPLERGRCIALPPTYLNSWLGPVAYELLLGVNKAVVGIPAKLSAGETHRDLCSSLAGEVTSLKATCKQLEASKKALESQVEKLKKQGLTQKNQEKSQKHK